MDLSIQNVPDDLVDKLRERATRNDRSIEDELLAIFEAALKQGGTLTPQEVVDRAKALGFGGANTSTAIIRAMRDAG